MKVSLTGTFSISRKELEEKISEIGHEVVDLSGKTEILLVGEETASPKKIAKAEAMGVKIIREVDADEILKTIVSSVSSSSYVTHYDRLDEEGNPSSVEVGVNEAAEVLGDYISVSQDEGEWFPEEDGARDLISIIGGNGDYIEAGELENALRESLGATIKAVEKKSFFTVFYRLIFLRILCQEIESEVGPYCEPKDNISSKEALKEGFYENIADFISFEEPEDIENFRKNDELKKIIAKTKEDEKGIGR